MPPVKHVVLMKFKRDAPLEAAEEVMTLLADLKHTIPGIVDYSAGIQGSIEGLHQGFTHGFVMTFTDEAARDAYLPHPQHEAVKEKIIALLDGGLSGAVVFDWVE
jgi:hypothetical protein